MRGRPIKENEVKRFKAELEKTVNHIDTYFLKDKHFLCGDDISAADLKALCELQQLLGVGDEDLYLSNPRLKAWAERVTERVKPYLGEANKNGILILKVLYEQRLKNAKL